MRASFKKHTLNFINPAGTSRGVYLKKDSWFILLAEGDKTGTGECSILKDLSIDNGAEIENKLAEICDQINYGIFNFKTCLSNFPSIQFGLETALLDLKNGGNKLLFSSNFSKGHTGITTNGLIWMGDFDFMKSQISKKLEDGFSCIKLKIGTLEWKKERLLIEEMRRHFSANELTIRVDANGAYSRKKAIQVLHDLDMLDVHSIEQPIKAGNWEIMAELCDLTPVPIALDEELIGVQKLEKKLELIEVIRPQYIILKPSLLGGMEASDEWIRFAEEEQIGWWATSALESNIGLNAIAQWVAAKDITMPQGLGTGSLFSNNIQSPLDMRGEQLFYSKQQKWGEV